MEIKHAETLAELHHTLGVLLERFPESGSWRWEPVEFGTIVIGPGPASLDIAICNLKRIG